SGTTAHRRAPLGIGRETHSIVRSDAWKHLRLDEVDVVAADVVVLAPPLATRPVSRAWIHEYADDGWDPTLMNEVVQDRCRSSHIAPDPILYHHEGCSRARDVAGRNVDRDVTLEEHRHMVDGVPRRRRRR